MARDQPSRDDLAAMARAVGLELGDERLDSLLLEVRELAEAFERLGRFDLERHEPALVFRPRTE